MAAPVPPPDVDHVEEIFFLEGVDGHAESMPSSEPDGSLATHHLSAETADAALSDEEWLEAEEEVEDPARTRRRRALRIGVAWGAVAAVALVTVVAFMSPRRADDRSVALSTSAASAAPAVSSPSVAAPASPAPAPVAAAVTPAPAHATAAPAATTARSTPRTTVRKKGAAPSQPASKASGPRGKRAPAPSTPRTAPKRKHA